MTEIIYCIPLITANLDLISKDLKKNSQERYILTSNSIFDTKTNKFYEVIIESYTFSLKQAFSITPSIGESDIILKEIDNHKLVLYLIIDALDMKLSIDLVQVLLLSGGIAVKNEITGISFSKNEWEELVSHKDNDNLIKYFINIVNDGEATYSIGMNQFNIPDCLIYTTNPTYELVTTIYMEIQKILENKDYLLDQSIHSKKTTDFRHTEDDISFNLNGILVI